MTTWLIFVPLAGALVVWLLPLRTAAQAGGLALLIALADLALWVGTAANFDFTSTGTIARSFCSPSRGPTS